MSDLETKQLPAPTPESRRIAAERFDRANQVLVSGNHDYAIQLLLTCCKLDPMNLLYRQTLRRTQKAKYNNNLRGSRLAFLTTIRTRTRLRTAKRSRNHLAVLEYGEQLLSRNPWDLGVQMDMAEAADALGSSDMAIFLLDQARQKFPKDATLNRALARLFEKRGNFTHAIALWQLVREAAPDDVEAAHKAKDLAASETIQKGGYETSGSGEKMLMNGNKSALASAEPAKDRVTREASTIQSRIEANPTDPNLYIQLAGLFRRNRQEDRARAALEQGLGPTSNHYLLTIELMEMNLDPFRRDLEIAQKKIANPEEEDELEKLQRIEARLQKEIQSREMELYRLKANRYPQDASHRLELGIRLYKIDQIDEAIVEFQNARKDPRFAWKASLHLGMCFKKRNNWRMAQRNLEEALTQLPANEQNGKKEVLFYLATGFAEANDLKKAIDLGHDLANIDFGYRDIGKLLDQWEKAQNDDS